MILLLGMVFFAACSDDNSKEVDWRSPIKIVNSDILFEGGKATGGLRVAAPAAITAQISASWCHIAVVNGDSITVSVDENKEMQGVRPPSASAAATSRWTPSCSRRDFRSCPIWCPRSRWKATTAS